MRRLLSTTPFSPNTVTHTLHKEQFDPFGFTRAEARIRPAPTLYYNSHGPTMARDSLR